jgi:hypothetical protein
MNRFIQFGVICSLLLVFLAGLCVADEAPSNLVYVQGGECSITNGTDGTYVITVTDVIPYVHFANGNKSSLISVEELTNLTYPLNAVLEFSGVNSETSMVAISNVSISDGNMILTLQAKDLEFYKGSSLKTFASDSKNLKVGNGIDARNTGLYLEIIGKSPNNGDSVEDCMAQCKYQFAYCMEKCLVDS